MPANSNADHAGVTPLTLGLREDGFAFVQAADMHALLAAHGRLEDWTDFVASWNELPIDNYLAAVGRQRRRRHAVYCAPSRGPITRAPHQAHFQTLNYNTLQGDIERWFEPVDAAIAEGPTLSTVLGFARDFFAPLSPQVAAWHVEVHQFRIEPSATQAGEPTPEGVHRDGVDYVLVLLVDRKNIRSGTTTIHTHDGREVGSFTLTEALDAALVDDARVFHGVTAVTPVDTDAPAHRDVLVVTFRALTA
ncbi:2OG-Fe dioxygenase family protein [Montanilutibacter psychrotolerans]|nr:2OG-Fe dioxygenase family protein [Lysobacter psychrotolerans]